jgi:hypothetical protein
MADNRYRNFGVAIYARVYEVQKMADPEYLRASFDAIARNVKIGHVYLETHRDRVVAEESTLLAAKAFFEERGIGVSGGITVTVSEPNRFQTFCYTDPELRRALAELAAYTARIFGDFILDDFFFTNCKCSSCIAAKGERSWTEFRRALMAQAAQELVLAPAKAANPRAKATIKYPNWYEHFPALGFDLEAGPELFDAIYTGTETRDQSHGHQHLQPYESYEAFRYYENIAPGRNGGGWVDPFGIAKLERYAEQLALTLLAKAPEVTLFDFGNLASDPRLPPAAGAAFEAVDAVLGDLGEPVGLAACKPLNSLGEDYLHNYLGTIGIPIEMRPDFPADASAVLVTEASAADPDLVAKMKERLMAGGRVVATSGLYEALVGKGIEDIVELRPSARALFAREFHIGWDRRYPVERPIAMRHLDNFTNDAWEEVSAFSEASGAPLLLSAKYGRGELVLLVIPDDPGDLYCLPPEVLGCIRCVLCRELPFRIEGPSGVALFLYGDDRLVLQSFRDDEADLRIISSEGVAALEDLVSGEKLSPLAHESSSSRERPEGARFACRLKPHSSRAFSSRRV